MTTKFSYNRISLAIDWTAEGVVTQMIIVNDFDTDFHMRLYHLAKARVNNNGHAQFSPGEISRTIQTLSKKTGTVEDASKWTVNRGIKKLVDMQILNARSNARCLWFMPNIIDKGKPGGGSKCFEHGVE